MTRMKSLKHGAIALLLVTAFMIAGVYEAQAVQALYGTYGKGEYSASTLVEIDQNTGEIIRIIGQVGHAVNGLAWDPTTEKLYGSARESLTDTIINETHDGASGSTILVDSDEDFIAEGVLVGMQVQNTTDGSWGTITAVSTTTITAPLIGGSDNLWDNGDSYRVQKVTFNGLLEIDLATGEGTPVGLQGWGLDSDAPIVNIAVNSSGQMYGWTEQSTPGVPDSGDDLVIINKYTGVATWVGDSDLSTYANGLAFDSNDTLYFVNGDGDYYIMNTGTGAATLQGFLTPGDELPAHHGVFNLNNNVYYGIRNDKYPWDNSSAFLVRANLTAGTVLSVVPTAYDLHTLAFVNLPGLVDLDLQYDGMDNEMTVTITVGNDVPAVMLVRLFIWNQVYYLANVTLPPIDPRESNDFTVSFPRVGEVGVLITLLTQNGGIAHSVWKTVDTGF